MTHPFDPPDLAAVERLANIERDANAVIEKIMRGGNNAVTTEDYRGFATELLWLASAYRQAVEEREQERREWVDFAEDRRLRLEEALTRAERAEAQKVERDLRIRAQAALRQAVEERDAAEKVAQRVYTELRREGDTLGAALSEAQEIIEALVSDFSSRTVHYHDWNPSVKRAREWIASLNASRKQP